MFNVRSARAPPPANLESGLPRACRLRRPPSHALPPHALQARTSPRMHRTPSLRLHSAGRVGLQPAAELRHVQRHDHVQHVLRALRACPVPQALSRAFPRACPLAPPPHTLPPPDPRLACALLLTRQGAWAFNQPLSFDTAKVTGGAGKRFTGMRYMFRVRPRVPWSPSLESDLPRAHAACAATTPLPPPGPPPRPASHAPSFDSAVHAGVQPAAELRHGQGHGHGRHVLRACPDPSTALSRAPCMPLAPPRCPTAPPRLPGGPHRMWPPFRFGSTRRRSTSR